MPEHTPEAQALMDIVRAARDVKDAIAAADKEASAIEGDDALARYVIEGSVARALVDALERADKVWIESAIGAFRKTQRPAEVRHAPAPRVPEKSIGWWLPIVTNAVPKGGVTVEVPALLAEPVAHAARYGVPLTYYLCGERPGLHVQRVTHGEPPKKCPGCVRQIEPAEKIPRELVAWYGPAGGRLRSGHQLHAVRKDDANADGTLGGTTLCGLEPGGWYFGALVAIAQCEEMARAVAKSVEAGAGILCPGCSQRIDYAGTEE